MHSELLTENIWPKITEAAKCADKPAFVAVAYFAKGASDLLPLVPGSSLVVDASDRTVSAGLTSPAELLRLYKKGVRIFNYPGLHAKVFQIGNQLFVGSTNVSNNSAHGLQEAVISTDDASLIRDAKKFIRSLYQEEIGLETLARLQKMYKVPKFRPPLPGNRGSNSKRINGPTVYVVPLVVLKRYDTTNQDYISGRAKAESLIKDKYRHIVEDYKASIRSKPKVGDIVIRKTLDEGEFTVSPPATIIAIRKIKGTKRQYVYVEALNIPDKKLLTVNRKLKTTELNKGGKKNASLAAKLNGIWN